MTEWSAAEVVSGTGDAAFATYDSGRVAGWNQAAQELLGYSSDEVLGLPTEALLPDGGESHPRRRRVEEPASRFHARARHSDGRRVPLGVSVVRLPRPSGTSPLLLHIMVPEESPSALTSTLGPDERRAATATAEFVLTPRETEILQLLADGKPAQAITEQLFVSLPTVRTHIRNILQKLQVHSQLEAVALALRKRLI